MELNENYELQRCRDYKEEAESLEKALYLVREENEALRREVESLKECIVKMSIARYLRNGT